MPRVIHRELARPPERRRRARALVGRLAHHPHAVDALGAVGLARIVEEDERELPPVGERHLDLVLAAEALGRGDVAHL